MRTMRKMLLLLATLSMIISVPLVASAAGKTTRVFDGTYSGHTYMTGTFICPPANGVAGITNKTAQSKPIKLVVANGVVNGHAIYFPFSDDKTGDVKFTINAGAITLNYSITFSVLYSGVSVIGSIHGGGSVASCTESITGSTRANRVSK